MIVLNGILEAFEWQKHEIGERNENEHVDDQKREKEHAESVDILPELVCVEIQFALNLRFDCLHGEVAVFVNPRFVDEVAVSEDIFCSEFSEFCLREIFVA